MLILIKIFRQGYTKWAPLSLHNTHTHKNTKTSHIYSSTAFRIHSKYVLVNYCQSVYVAFPIAGCLSAADSRRTSSLHNICCFLYTINFRGAFAYTHQMVMRRCAQCLHNLSMCVWLYFKMVW